MATSSFAQHSTARRTLPSDVLAPVVVVQSVAPAASPRRELPPDVVTDVHPVAQAGAASAAAVALGLKEPSYRDELDDSEVPEAVESERSRTVLDYEGIYAIIREVALGHSGEAAYTAVSADAEIAAADHPSAGRHHFGLCFGLVLFSQESGQLGRVLQLWQKRNPAAVVEILGPSAQTVLEVTTRPDPQGRLEPVGEGPLWTDPWLRRFQLAGENAECQQAQNEQAIEEQFRPALPTLLAVGLDTSRALGLGYDTIVARGLGGGLRWIVQQCTPLRTRAQREHALSTLGYASIAEFQTAVGRHGSGVLDATLHARLVAALRSQGLVPLPSAAEISRRLVTAASGRGRERLERLLLTDSLADEPLVGG